MTTLHKGDALGYLGMLSNMLKRKPSKPEATASSVTHEAMRAVLVRKAEEARDEKKIRFAAVISCDSRLRQAEEKTDRVHDSICRRISGLDDEVLVAVHRASVMHQKYDISLIMNLSENGDMHVRDTALFFAELQEVGTHVHEMTLRSLRLISGHEDLSRLHQDNPEGASALLGVITHYLKIGHLIREMHPDLAQILLREPEMATPLIEFAKQRNISIEAIHPKTFTDALSVTEQPMRAGIL